MPRDESLFSVDQRIFLQTLFGNREPITEADFSQRELDNIVAAVQRNQKRTGATTKGNVGYDDYPSGDEIQPGYAPIESTLGRFNYRMSPLSELQATDRYDFWNDERKANVERYENMPAWKRNVTAPLTSLGYLLSLKPRSAAGELGDAFIGREGRDVKIKIPAKKAKGGAVHMGIGGLLKLKNAVKGAQKVLPAAERDANLAKMLESSKVKERLYHATPQDIKEFKPGGKNPNVSGYATWLSNDPKRQPAMHNISGGQEAEFREGTNVMPVYVQAKNPMLLDDKDMLEWAQAAYAGGSKQFPQLMPKKWVDEVSKDYDSIILADPFGLGDAHEVIMFDPKKIKSAISNRGTYDITDPDIGKAKGGAVHMDEGGAAFGVFPQMKARRAQQDRTAAANAPLSALRGWAAGTAGLPGDIEGLARAGISQLPPQLLTAFPALRAFGIGSRADPTPQMPTTEFYNEYLPGAQLNQTPTGKLFTGAGNVLGGTGATSIARLGIKSTAELADLAARIAAESPRSGSRAAQLGIVKLPDGNFLTGRTEKDLSPLKQDITGRPIEDAVTYGYQPPVTPETTALNNWVDSNLTNYVKKQMGTADDPVRLMFDKRAQEIDAQYAKDIEKSERIAKRATGESNPRKQANLMREAERIKAEANIERQTAVNHISHKPALLDEYLNDPLSGEQVRRAENIKKQRTEAGFPEEGLGQSPMAKAWEISSDEVIASHRAGDIQNSQFVNYSPYMGYKDEVLRDNPWINKLAPETKVYSAFTGDLGFDHIMDVLREDVAAGRIRPDQMNKISITDAIRRTSEYDRDLAAKMNASRAAAREGLPTYREYPEGYKWIQLNRPGAFAQESDAMGHSVRGYEPPKGHPDWVEASGDAGSLGYGQGGWEAIKSGKNKVYSLVDSKGAPHATVEVKTKGVLADTDFGANDARIVEGRGDFGERGYRTTDNQFFETYADAVSHEKAIQKPTPQELKEPPRITQIKGKGNRAPNDEYLPYVQDFVKGSNWSGVDDLKNTGLTRKSDLIDKFSSDELDAIGAGEYLTKAEQDDLLLRALRPPEEGMAQGGLVSNHFDPIKIKQIIAGLDDEYDPENIQQIIAQRESAYA